MQGKLTKGQVIPTYKWLCKYLEIPALKTGSNQHKAQLKTIAQYYKWHKIGHVFIIDEVYDTPLP